MNALLNKDIITAIATEMLVDYSYIEKDYYALKILEKVATFNTLNKKAIFTGGTSLSKGYGIIQRFSEDLDFEIDNSDHLTEGQRRTIRHDFINLIKQIKEIQIVETFAENGGRKQTLLIKYPHLFPIPENLRDNLKIELFFAPNPVVTEQRKIDSFVGKFTNNQENILVICNLPFNIMVDKFNALVWRIYADDDNFDYTIMRHLHDLFAISEKYRDNKTFKQKVLDNFEQKDSKRIPNIKFNELLQVTVNKLKSNNKYQKGYEKFVDSMSYAPDLERITFEKALNRFLDLAKLFDY